MKPAKKFDREDGCEVFFSGLCAETSKGKPILRNVNGKFPGGSLVAIMGTSGAGKTTLLNSLSGYRSQHASCLKLQINGTDTDFDHLAHISCYLTQDIHLNDLLSVEENMRYAADFKLGVTHSGREKSDIVDELLDSFGLHEARRTRAGKLSGGERKRLALALEMISDPRIIFLDEPTTGLDISTTHQILAYLKKIAGAGKTVVCTIHQVCASHFDLFDLAYVIAGGQCAYQGRPQDLVAFLDDNGLPCSIYHNPAEYLIELCSGDYGDDKADNLISASQNGNAYIRLHPQEEKQQAVDINKLVSANATWGYQFRTLMFRETTKMSRNLILVPMRIIGSNILAFFIGTLFLNFGNDASKVLFVFHFVLGITANVLLTGFMYPILSFPLETELIKREHYNRYYTLLQYYLTIFFLDLPISLLTISTSTMLAWYMAGLPIDMERIIVYQIFMITFGCIVNAIGFFFGTLNLSIGASLMLCSVSQLPMMVFSGYAMLFQDMYWLYERLGRLGYVRNAVQGCAISVFGLIVRKLDCPEEEVYCFYKEPHRLLVDMGIDPFHYGHNFLMLVLWLFVIRFGTYFTMKYRLSL